MKKIKMYIATSLNGKIARSNGEVDWLEKIPNPEKTDHGYADFYAGIDTTIQGYNTYAQLQSWDIPFPYSDKTNYVLTRNTTLTDNQDVQFIRSDHLEHIRRLKQQTGKDIWLIGGAQVNTLLWNAGLIDEILLFVMPVVLPEGIDLFAGGPKETSLKLINSISYSTGATQLHYRVENS